MTDRLISLDYALTQLRLGELEHGGNFETDSYHVKEFLSVLPIVDTSAVKHGRWIKEENSIHCSVCGYRTSAMIPYVDNGDKWVPLYTNKYCGNCGAKMEDE